MTSTKTNNLTGKLTSDVEDGRLSLDEIRTIVSGMKNLSEVRQFGNTNFAMNLTSTDRTKRGDLNAMVSELWDAAGGDPALAPS